MVPLRYNVRSLFVRKLTTFATAIGIALVVFVFAASLMLAEGVRRAVDVGGKPDQAIVLRKGSDNELSSGFAQTNIALLGKERLTQDVVGEIVIVITCERSDHSGGISNLLIRGMPKSGFELRKPEFQIISGREPLAPDEVVIGRAVNGRFLDPLKPNGVIELGNQFSIRTNRPFKVVGVFSAGGANYESEVWGDLETVRKYSGRETIVSSARVKLKAPEMFDAFKDEVERDPQMSLKVMREADYIADQSEQMAGFLTLMGTIIAVMFSLAAMIGAAITMNAAVANRSREIGTLRALGFGKFSILVAFVFEAIFLAAIGGLIGSAFVLLLSFVSFPIINFQTFSEVVISFTATPAVFIKALIFSAAMGLIGGLFPAIRAARVSPVEAMRA